MSKQISYIISREHKIANRGLDGIWNVVTPVVMIEDAESGLLVSHVRLQDQDDFNRFVTVPTNWVKRANV